ncbi:MAG: tetratricopeptide repeat protein [Bacteroidia bacterium]|nr:tetratricopeptide repeat protein [Bacteroidia bacterium]
MKYVFGFVFFLFLFPFSGTAQEQSIDSLKLELKKATHDSLRCRILNVMIEMEVDDNIWPVYNEELRKLCEKNLENYKAGEKMYNLYMSFLAGTYNNDGYLANNRGETKKALDLYYKSMDMEEKIGNTQGIAISLNNIGSAHQNLGEIDKALDCYKKSMALSEKIGYEMGVAESLNNIGLLYDNRGDISSAMEYYKKSVKIQERIKDYMGLSKTFNNIGAIYSSQNDLPKALEYYEKCFKLQEKINDAYTMAGSLHNMASIYSKQGNFEKALLYLEKSLAISEEAGNIASVAFCYNSLGALYQKQGDPAKALLYWRKSYEYWEKLGDKQGMALSANHIAVGFSENGQMQAAIDIAEKSLKLSQELHFPGNIMDASGTLSRLYSKTGNWKKAYDMEVLFKQMSDSLNNENKRKAFLRKALQYEYEKKVTADSIKTAEARKVFDAKLREQKVQRTALFVGIGLVTLFALFMYNRFRITQKQKQIIEQKEKETQQQKLIIEEKHKEISDSINYAERIQRIFLATKEILDANLKEYFVLFKPKAIVSGDFYWAATLNDKRFVLVTADSTGHGVPGAIMSLLNITSLEKAIERSNTPAQILNITRENIIDRLKKDGSEEGGKDGMDCSLMVFDFVKLQMDVAAAHNPVWVVRTENGKTEFIESGFDKMPVGKHAKDSESFTEFNIPLKKGDMVYSVTDGFSDQFGGSKGKKFMQKRLKELLLSISQEDARIQQLKLSEALSDWIGVLEQVDDITVVGVRI